MASGHTQGFKSVIVCEGIPWWSLLVARMGGKVIGAWTKIDVSKLPFVQRYFMTHPSYSAVSMTEVKTLLWHNQMRNEADVVFFDRHPRDVPFNEVWTAKSPQLIIVGQGVEQGFRSYERNGWHKETFDIVHAEVGGVTAEHGKFTVYSRNQVHLRLMRVALADVKRTALIQDLRCVLKAGIKELPTKATERDLIPYFSSEVCYIYKGLISSAGLLPHPLPSDLRVKTILGGQMWIKRRIQVSEILAAYDVPDQMLRLDGEVISAEELVTLTPRPIKVLQALSEGVKRILNTDDSRERDQKKRRGISDDSAIHPSKKLKWVGLDAEEVFQLDNFLKAAKNDDAPPPIEMWNHFLLRGLSFQPTQEGRDWEKALVQIRKLGLRWWKRDKFRTFTAWRRGQQFASEEERIEVNMAAADALTRAMDATWWDWPAGSRLFFWNWPLECQTAARVGWKWRLRDGFKPTNKRQRVPKNGREFGMVRKKLEVIRDKRYVTPGPVHALMFFFSVPKGSDDIRMVYDGTASGLNEFLWCPWFLLPTIDSLLRNVEPGTWMSDNDVGEMFLNFMLPEDMQAFCGIDISAFFPEEAGANGGRLVERWGRCAMGLKPSPHSCVKFILFALEVILGNPEDKENVFNWQDVVLNLPGTLEYNCSEPWVCKRRSDHLIAADVEIYVDDERPSGPTACEAWRASQRISSIQGSLGIQDAARKRRPPSQEPGAWAGSVCHTSDGQVTVLLSEDRWVKTKEMIAGLHEVLHRLEDPGKFDFKKLESERGSLVYVMRTYPAMRPYLRGIHATLDSWRPGRDEDGWKLPKVKGGETEKERSAGSGDCHEYDDD